MATGRELDLTCTDAPEMAAAHAGPPAPIVASVDMSRGIGTSLDQAALPATFTRHPWTDAGVGWTSTRQTGRLSRRGGASPKSRSGRARRPARSRRSATSWACWPASGRPTCCWTATSPGRAMARPVVGARDSAGRSPRRTSRSPRPAWTPAGSAVVGGSARMTTERPAHPYIPNSAPGDARGQCSSDRRRVDRGAVRVGARGAAASRAAGPSAGHDRRSRPAPPCRRPAGPQHPHDDGAQLPRRRLVERALCRPSSTRSSNRAEFITSYGGGPYADLGKYQAIFEFQSLIGELVGMDVVSAPMYDGVTATSSALLMATRLTGRPRVLVPETPTPRSAST